MSRTPTQDLERRLSDPEYARLYGSAQAKSNFAITLSRARRSSGMTQRELAAKLRVSQSYIAKLERGEANPTLGTVGSILAVFGLRLGTLAEPLEIV